MSVSASAQTKYLLSTVTASPSDKGLPSCVISTINADRDHDHVIPEGMDATAFMRAPVLMWSHGGSDRYAALPIGTVTSLNVTPGQGITASWKWLENDPWADRVKNAWEQGVVRGTSIGFRPTKMEPNAQGGVDHLAWELLELSVCPIPANPEAVRTLKALGLMDDEPEPIVEKVIHKRGRVVSAVNESRLRAAMDALASASSVLTEVLAQLMPMNPDMDDDEEMDAAHSDEEMDPKKPHKPMMPMMAVDEPALYSLRVAEDSDEPSGLRLLLAEDDTGPFLTLVDDQNREPTFSIDPAVMRSVVAEAVRDQLQAALVRPIGESIQRALDHARGRVQ